MKNYYKRMRPLLGTFVEIGISKDSAEYEAAVSAAFSEIEIIQKLLSFHDLNSDLSKLNSNMGAWIRLNQKSVLVLRLARWMTRFTGGYFNCTVGGKMIRYGKLPNHDSSNAIDVGTHEDIEIRGYRVRLKRPVRVTLDGIAKGCAVDIAVKRMKKMGVSKGWINAGGDLKVFGNVNLPVRRREHDSSFTEIGNLSDIAMATSAIKKEDDSRFPGIILSPDCIEPKAGIWTIVASSAWLADVLTKVAALAPDDDKQEMLGRVGGNLIFSNGNI